MATVEVYADVVCPFAYVGLTRLIERRRELGRDDVRFRIRAWPLELVNGHCVDGHAIGEEVDQIKPQVAPDLFTRFAEHRFPGSSLPALALTSAAYAIDDVTGETVAMELRRLLFEDGRDVSDPDVLAEVAERHGVGNVANTDEVRQEWRTGQQREVIGSPHFFVDGESVFCPVLDIHHEGDALVVKVDHDAYERFVTRCFG